MFAWLTKRKQEIKPLVGEVVVDEAVTIANMHRFETMMRVFETIWVADHVRDNYDAPKALSDDDYIKYHQWERSHCEFMYRKYLPKAIVIRGENPNIIFHGGCIGCTMQQLHGINVCKGCEYFKFNGNLPYLNNDED